MPYNEQEKKILIALGHAIRKHRIARGWSQEELAFQSGLDRTYVGSVERGERNIATLNLLKIAKTLEVPVGNFMRDLEEQ